MSHRRDNGHGTVKHRLGHFSGVKGPQILNGAAAPAHDYHIHSLLFQSPNASDHTGRRLISLDNGGIEQNLHIGIAPGGNLYNIPHRRPGVRRYHPQRADKPGDGLFILGSKHAQFPKFLL